MNGKGVSSNTYGFYSLTLVEGLYEINYTFLGYKIEKKQITLNKNIDLNVDLETSSYTIEEVEVKGSSNIVQKTQASVIEVPIEQIKSIPALFGEVDVLKLFNYYQGYNLVKEHLDFMLEEVDLIKI